MKVLVFGKTGQVGRELQQRAGDVVIESLGRDRADFEDPESCAAHATATDADALIIAAAWTGVDAAEAEPERAMRINAETPGAIARAAAARGLPLVLLSTDYVFDGSGTTPFAPDHPTAPLGAYGRSKAAGEREVRAAGGVHAILRTSWVVSAHGRNFVKTMLRLGAERDRVSVVADQIGGPTPAAAIASACLNIAAQLHAAPQKSGTYHFSGAPDVSWADFAREIFARAGLICRVEDIATSDYPTPAARPLNSRLDNSLTEQTFSLQRPDWHTALDEIIRQAGTSAP